MKEIVFCLVFVLLLVFVLAEVSSLSEASFFVEPGSVDGDIIESDSFDVSFFVGLILILVVAFILYYFIFVRRRVYGVKKKRMK